MVLNTVGILEKLGTLWTLVTLIHYGGPYLLVSFWKTIAVLNRTEEQVVGQIRV